MQEKNVMNLRDAAAYLSLTVPTLRRLVRGGKIRVAHPQPYIYRFARAELDDWLRGSPTRQEETPSE